MQAHIKGPEVRPGKAAEQRETVDGRRDADVGAESDYQAACAIAIVDVALSLGLFSLYRLAARRLGG
jgi:hypothetical protein